MSHRIARRIEFCEGYKRVLQITKPTPVLSMIFILNLLSAKQKKILNPKVKASLEVRIYSSPLSSSNKHLLSTKWVLALGVTGIMGRVQQQ